MIFYFVILLGVRLGLIVGGEALPPAGPTPRRMARHHLPPVRREQLRHGILVVVLLLLLEWVVRDALVSFISLRGLA